MRTYCITFGVKYRREPHPVLGDMHELPDGWVTIEANDEEEAREWLIENLDNAYCSISEEEIFRKFKLGRYYELGDLGDVREMVKDPNDMTVERVCMICGRQSRVKVPVENMRRYLGGAAIQNAFPDHPSWVREIILTGIHPECWETLKSDDDD